MPKGLGVDILEIKRFVPFRKDRNNRFLKGNFSKKELSYCFAFKNPVPHLVGTFAAKEAVFKALGKKNNFLFSKLEIRREKNGEPKVWLNNRPQKSILISISHTATMAIAIAIKK